MKRFFLLSLFCTLLSLGAWAETVTLDWSSITTTATAGNSDYVKTVSPITATFSLGTHAQNAPRENKDGQVNCYTGNTITIASSTGVIQHIDFTFSAEGYSAYHLTYNNTPLEASKGGITFSWDVPSPSATVVLTCNNTARIKKMVVTYGTPAPSTTYSITIDNTITHGSVTASPTTAAAGAIITLTATPATGYKFDSWYVLDGDAEEITVSDNKFTMPASDVEVSATFTEISSHVVKFSVNGTIDESYTRSVEEGSSITFPSDLLDICGKVFCGWTKAADYSNVSAAPTDLCKVATMGTGDVIYYAVFANFEEETNLTKLGASATFSDGDNIAIFAYVDEKYYGLYQQTVSNSYVGYYVLDQEPVITDMDDEKKYVTLHAANANKWYIGDDENGFLYNSSNNMYASTNDGEKSEYTISWNADKNAFTIKLGSRWIACRNDLTGNNKYNYRGAGTSSESAFSNNIQSVGYFNIYRFSNVRTYSNYTTTVETSYVKEITAGNLGYYTICLPYAATPATGATYYNVASVNKNGETVTGITLEAISGNLEAGKPYIVEYPADATYTATYTGSPVVAAVETVGLVGNLNEATMAVPQGAYVIGGDNKLHKVTGDEVIIRKNSAYIDLTEVPDYAPEPMGGAARKVVAVYNESTIATDLENVDAANAVKFFENGTLYIQKNGHVYNVAGQLVK